MKIPMTIGNRTRNIPVYSAYSQPTEPPLRYFPSRVMLDMYNVPLDISATYKNQIKLTVQVMTLDVGIFVVLLRVSVMAGR